MRAETDREWRTDIAARRWPGRVGAGLAVVVAGPLIALLAFGLSARSPNGTIDDRLAQGQTAPAPAFDLAILQRGDPGKALKRRLTHAFSTRKLEGLSAAQTGIPAGVRSGGARRRSE